VVNVGESRVREEICSPLRENTQAVRFVFGIRVDILFG
jgi:hypothetical protein